MALITTAHVDGACSQNTDKIGGWAAVLDHGRLQKVGYAENTTNNRMELAAIKAAIIASPNDRALNIRSDSEWAIKCLSGEYDAKKNVEELQEIKDLIASHPKGVTLTWIPRNSEPSHAKADHLAGIQVEQHRKRLAVAEAEKAPSGSEDDEDDDDPEKEPTDEELAAIQAEAEANAAAFESSKGESEEGLDKVTS